jgi:hypothetical protein
MTKQEFIARQRTMEAAANKRGLKWFLVFFVGMVSAIPASNFAEAHYDIAWLAPAVALGFLVLLVGSVGWMVAVLRRQQKQFGVTCPHCGKALISFCSAIAIASGNCGRCGEPVFEQSSNQSQSKG